MAPRTPPQEQLSPADALRWYAAAGVDECTGEEPLNRYAEAEAAAAARATAPEAPAPARQTPEPPARPPAAAGGTGASPAAGPPRPHVAGAAQEAVHAAYERAAVAGTLEALREAVAGFDGCALKKTATNLVFADGAVDARIIMIGEAPGADEDRQGLPFVGVSGQLLDRMLGSVGLDRSQVIISNTVFWRPPGNRSPSTAEVAACQPFVERLIELVDPAVVVALGGAAAKSLLGRNEAVGRLRGRWFSFTTPAMSHPVAATAMFHPAYLLRSPAQKRQAWQDMLGLRDKMRELTAG